jgi:hypothetical protein
MDESSNSFKLDPPPQITFLRGGSYDYNSFTWRYRSKRREQERYHQILESMMAVEDLF